MDKLSLKRQNGQALSNAWITMSGTWPVELVAHAEYDVITIDAQHGMTRDLGQLVPMLQAMKGHECVPFVRVPWNDPAYLMAVLDAGALGIICPMINNAEETEAFVAACLYPPHGSRSFGPLRASLVYKDYYQVANRQICTMAMIETADAYQNLEEIAAVPHLSGLFMGPWDLSLSMGLSTIADFRGADFQAIFQRFFKVCQKHHLLSGVHCTQLADALYLRDIGFELVTVFNDSLTIGQIAQENLKAFRLNK